MTQLIFDSSVQNDLTTNHKQARETLKSGKGLFEVVFKMPKTFKKYISLRD